MILTKPPDGDPRRPSKETQFELYIKTTPDLLWRAIVDLEIRARYNFGARMTSDWTKGASIEVRSPDGAMILGTGEVLEADPPKQLVHTL
jgi:uncharacterized protein YndB with AHSA1/START domain